MDSIQTKQTEKKCNFLEKTGTKIAKRMAYACVCHFFFVNLRPILKNKY